ncbi:MAG: hypothetical protein PUF99_04515 [Bacilli bacterium]|nr:hypothetical protein [Bacilli bacterium]
MDNFPKKPNDWPRNQRECEIENIFNIAEKFQKDPTIQNKELLIELTTFDSANKNYNVGVNRFTEFESALINKLFFKFKVYGFEHGISYLYQLIWTAADLAKLDCIINHKSIGEVGYKGLIPQLQFYFLTVLSFKYEKNRMFADELCYQIDNLRLTNLFSPIELTSIFVNVLYDISNKDENIWFQPLNFSRDEIKKLFSKVSELIKNSKESPNERPLSSVLRMTMANLILKSRNNYEFTKVYKCISERVLESSLKNEELWMRKKSGLNDKREGKTFKEIFSTRKWIKYDWAKKLSFSFERNSYTCSFSKEEPSNDMKKAYGNLVIGFKSDAVSQRITTNYKCGEIIKFSQVIEYDVIYNKNQFKDEMNFLFQIIDLFNITNEEKLDFLNNIIDYWKLSVKDSKWSSENERRYEVMHFDEYEYINLTIEKGFMKNKSLMIIYPDFLIGTSKYKGIIKNNCLEKTRFNSTKDFLFCNDCFNHSYEWDSINNKKCDNCLSTNVIITKRIDS